MGASLIWKQNVKKLHPYLFSPGIKSFFQWWPQCIKKSIDNYINTIGCEQPATNCFSPNSNNIESPCESNVSPPGMFNITREDNIFNLPDIKNIRDEQEDNKEKYRTRNLKSLFSKETTAELHDSKEIINTSIN